MADDPPPSPWPVLREAWLPPAAAGTQRERDALGLTGTMSGKTLSAPPAKEST